MGVDVEFFLQGVRFVWDPDKALRNVKKHGVRFEEAVEAFFDPFVRVMDASSDSEARDGVIGYTTGGRLLFVVHLEVDEDAFRIISARRATPAEQRTYEDQ